MKQGTEQLLERWRQAALLQSVVELLQQTSLEPV